MRIVYMGTPDFAVSGLEALYRAGHEILCVVSQPDKPVGRHAELSPTPVKAKAQEFGLPVLQPVKASDPEFIGKIRALAPQVIVVAAYGKILRKELLDIPDCGCVNIHGSLLPRWRGAAPIQWAVMSGDRVSGLTTMMMAEGMDTGDILLKTELPLRPDETGGSLFERLKDCAGPLIVETLDLLEKGELKPQKQAEELVTYAPPLTKEMGELDFSGEARQLECRIRGLYPWPGSYTRLNGRILKIHKAEVASEEVSGRLSGRVPGELVPLGKELYAVCGKGALRLKEVQPEGKKRMDAADFLSGYRALFQ